MRARSHRGVPNRLETRTLVLVLASSFFTSQAKGEGEEMTSNPEAPTPAAGTGELWTRCLRMVQQFLDENGFVESLRTLEKESGVLFNPTTTTAEEEPGNKPMLAGELMSSIQHLEDLEIAEVGTSKGRGPESDAELCTRPSGRFPRDSMTAVLKPHSSNVLCVKLDHNVERALVLSSSTDKTIVASSFWSASFSPSSSSSSSPSPSSSSPPTVWKAVMPAAVIAMDWNPQTDRIIAATMGGTSHVINGSTGAIEQSFTDHRKFAVATKWVLGGRGFVTGSHDRRVVLRREATAGGRTEEMKEWTFFGCVESIAVLGGERRGNGKDVVVSVRDDNRLHVIDLESGEVKELLNMNATGDDHVSFTALDVSVSPGGRHVLVSTDKDRLILFDIERGVQVRNFYGAANDEMSQPKHCWDSSGQYVFSTSQDNTIRVWEVSTQRAVAKLSGHSKMVRSIDFSSVNGGVLASGSYDATVRLWASSADH